MRRLAHAMILPRLLVIGVLVIGVLVVGGCEPPQQKPGGEGAKQEEAKAPEVAAKEEAKAPAPVAATTPEPATVDGDSRAGSPPPWYDENLYVGAKVLRKDRTETKLAGGFASAMVLELPEGTSAEQCMQSALAEIAKDVGKPVAELPTPDVGGGRQTVHGTDNGYDWTVVCGDAKGKPTMYLAYTKS